MPAASCTGLSAITDRATVDDRVPQLAGPASPTGDSISVFS
jgi:hypothetical protein